MISFVWSVRLIYIIILGWFNSPNHGTVLQINLDYKTDHWQFVKKIKLRKQCERRGDGLIRL